MLPAKSRAAKKEKNFLMMICNLVKQKVNWLLSILDRPYMADTFHKNPAQSYNFFLIYANKKNTKKVYIYIVYI